jgi:hypothetical protein
MKWLLAATVILITPGCKSETETPAPADMAVPELFTSESLVRDNAYAGVVIAHAVHVGAGMLTLAPTLTVEAGEQANMDVVRAETIRNLNGCGKVSLDGSVDAGAAGMLTVDFGAAPGCAFNGLQVSGHAALTLSVADKKVVASLVLTQVMADSIALDGAFTFTVLESGGGLFVSTYDSKNGTNALYSGLSAKAAAGQTMLQGDATLKSTDGIYTGGSLKQLLVKQGTCYASGGRIDISILPREFLVSFTASTPQTGTVMVAVRNYFGMIVATGEAQLSPYGSCPR